MALNVNAPEVLTVESVIEKALSKAALGTPLLSKNDLIETVKYNTPPTVTNETLSLNAAAPTLVSINDMSAALVSSLTLTEPNFITTDVDRNNNKQVITFNQRSDSR